MLDAFAVFTSTGLLLWTHSPERSEADVAEILNEFIDKMLSESFLKEREHSIDIGSFRYDWVLQKFDSLELVFVAIYQKCLPLKYIKPLLESVSSVFIQYNHTELGQPVPILKSGFTEQFLLLKDSAENEATSNTKGSREAIGTNHEVGAKSIKQRTAKHAKANQELDQLNYNKQEATASVNELALSISNVKITGELTVLEPVAKAKSSGKFVFDYFSSLLGQKALSTKDIEPFMKRLYEQLVTQNVASELAQRICDRVEQDLIGIVPGTFTSIAQIIKQSTEVVIRKATLSSNANDLLGDIRRGRRESKRPFVIAFVGVNGVGKSTNLCKIAFWLLQNQLRIIIAACDTFRSGAVEQLRTHVKNLTTGLEDPNQIRLLEKGYNRDATIVAKEAINYARTNNYDVVLIDTAGRMQDNSPLMRALAKLIQENQPDRVLFVGEALVGNEALDQLTKFNAALIDRRIDGVILSKFDTVDDKVGGVLNMSYAANAPVLFVGTGQTFTDLQRLNISTIVDSLLD